MIWDPATLRVGTRKGGLWEEYARVQIIGKDKEGERGVFN
jgi:hypothetical protein